MISHAMRRLVRTVGHGRRVLLVGVVLFGLLSAAVTPAHAVQLTLTWTDASTNEDGFTIERATGAAGAYGLLATVAAGTAEYVDATVTAGTPYCYRVRAYNTSGESAYSNEACATPASAALYTVTVSRAGTGSGTVASSPSAIDCGTSCSASVTSGTSLALSATPAAGSSFAGWGGACIGTTICAFAVAGPTSVTATFNTTTVPTPPSGTPTAYMLTVKNAGNGKGTVTSSPTVGITCGRDCSESYAAGTRVTLAAASAAGSTFTGWSGACTGTGTCTVTLNQSTTVTATFKRLRR